MKSNPDCTDQKFGLLTVLGKGGRKLRRNRNVQLWKLQCDCGKIIEIERGYFDRKKGQVSCGCKRRRGLVDNKRRPLDITGQKFGSLTAIALTNHKINSKPAWLMQCDCGGTRELSVTLIRILQRKNIRLNCGDKSKHTEKYLHYPETPNPYPEHARELVKKYLYLTNLQDEKQKVDSAVEDEKIDRLLRACFIISYRRRWGENISELHERRIIRKHLRFCSIDVFWKRKLEFHGGLIYTDYENKKKEIGVTMTDLTSESYPVIETQGINIVPKVRTPKRLRFNRC